MLAINTAFMTANLAIKTAKGQVVLKDIDAKSKHSENVLKTIDQMCQEANVNILDLKTVAVVVGPGSFTGLRIGTAIAKALGAVNKDLKFVSISSLSLMAYIASKKNIVSDEFYCVLNALSDLYFVCKFSKDGKKLEEEKMISREEYDKITQKKVALVGDLKFEDLIEIEISGQDLLDYALLLENEKKFVKEQDLLPVYLRLSQAEDMLSKKTKKDC